MSATPHTDRRGLALALLAVAQFIVVLDAAIVNVALPSPSPSAASCCSAAAWPTCSAGAACSSSV